MQTVLGPIDPDELGPTLMQHLLCDIRRPSQRKPEALGPESHARQRLVRWGGHGYGHIFANVVPMMRRRGFSESDVQAIVVDNPKRLLTLEPRAT